MSYRWMLMTAVLGGLLPTSCSDEGYRQGDCDPGYLDVNGVCKLAVGQPCEKNGECLANRCVKPEDEEGFCTIACRVDASCPTGFYCTSWADKLCYPGTRPPPCHSDQECEPCEKCSNGICQTISGCVVCQTDDDCRSCQRCDQGICIDVAGCTSCVSDLNCPPCEACNQNGECRRDLGCILCAADQDCPGCMQCTRGACKEIPGCGTDACQNDEDCPSRTQCILDSDLGHSVCMPSDLPFGADCGRGGDAVCGEGICLEAGGEATCTRACVDDSDCPSPTRCIPDEDCLWLCREPVSSPPGVDCQNDADCTGGRICGLVADDTGTAWRSRCVEPQNCAAASGAACDRQAGDRCTTGICTQEGYCSPVCAADFDCPEGFLCAELQLPLPSGTDAPFRGCAPEDLVREDPGEPCPNGDADCKSGLCLVDQPGGPHPFCSRECTPGAAECPDGFDCRQSPVDQRDLCQPSLTGGECGNDRDCQPGEVCSLNTISQTTQCIQPLPGGVLPGEPCSDLDLCANELCLRQGFCGAICTQPGDCPAGFICDYVEVYRSGDACAFTRICTPDPGSMLPCRRDGNCPAGEVCGLVPNAWGTGLKGRCTTAGPGGGIGTDCTAGYECENFFCSTEHQCTTLCVTDSDCPQDYACFDVRVADWQGTLFTVPTCIKTGAGSPLACLDDGTGSFYCLYP